MKREGLHDPLLDELLREDERPDRASWERAAAALTLALLSEQAEPVPERLNERLHLSADKFFQSGQR